MDRQLKHRSHISTKRTRSRGWLILPPKGAREQTRRQMREYQKVNCRGCRHANEALVGSGKPCCLKTGSLTTAPGICLSKEVKNEG